jgi:hypothetical protein
MVKGSYQESGADKGSPHPLQLLAKLLPDLVNRDPEYCLLSEEWNPVGKNPPYTAAFCTSTTALYQGYLENLLLQSLESLQKNNDLIRVFNPVSLEYFYN